MKQAFEILVYSILLIINKAKRKQDLGKQKYGRFHKNNASFEGGL